MDINFNLILQIGVVIGGVVSDKIVAKMGIRSRVAVLAISQLIATPFAFGSVIFEPMWAMINLGISYFFAEMWFGIVFAILVEVVPLRLRSTTVGIFLFVMNNIGGNLPILVDPVAKAYNYRVAINIFYAGFYLLSKFWIIFHNSCTGKNIFIFRYRYKITVYFLVLLIKISFRFGSLLYHNLPHGWTS